jgi:erythromycin esterase-like protein
LYNRRERVNADNLLWLANQYYRGEKLIVWSHNVHAALARFSPHMTGSLSAQVHVAPYAIVWPEVFDGLLFIQRMTPHEPVRHQR